MNKEDIDDTKSYIKTVLYVLKIWVLSKIKVYGSIKNIKANPFNKDIAKLFGNDINDKHKMSLFLYEYIIYKRDKVLLNDNIITVYDVDGIKVSIHYNPLMIYHGYGNDNYSVLSLLKKNTHIVIDNSYLYLSEDDRVKFIKSVI
jgi:hypothetical protein